jgi:hypothetical protein
MVVPSEVLSHRHLLDTFLAKLLADERVIEPISQRVMGTSIALRTFQKRIKDFCSAILDFLLDSLDFIEIFSKSHAVLDFFKVLESVLSVHYYSSTRMEAFDQHPLNQILDDFEPLAAFSAIWSFGSMMIADSRLKFEKLFRTFLTQHHLTIPTEYSLFDLHYSIPEKCWKPWDDQKLSLFFDNILCIPDLEPEHLVFAPERLLAAIHITTMLISQGKNVMVECPDPKLSRIVCGLVVNTTPISFHYSQLFCQYPNIDQFSDFNPLRKMIDESLNAIHDGRRSSNRLPLLAMMRFKLWMCRSTELLRSVLDYGTLMNLHTFTPEIATTVRYLISVDAREPDVNERLVRHFAVLRIPEVGDHAIVFAVARSLKSLCGINGATEIATAICKLTDEIDFPYRFNFSHMLKLLQRTAMVMEKQHKSYFPTALAFEAVAVFYDLAKSESTLEAIDRCVNSVATILSLKVPKVSPDRLLSNLSSDKCIPVVSIDEVLEVRNSPASLHHRRLSSIFQAGTDQKHSRFIENFDASELDIPPCTRPLEDQQEMLKIERMITTPRTHLLLNTDMDSLAESIVTATTDLLQFECTVFHPGANLHTLIHDTFITAGKQHQHKLLLVMARQLNHNDLELVKSMVASPDIFELFAANEILMIMSEIHCTDVDDDPFHEETLESKSQYRALVRDFLRASNHYFHICVVASPMLDSFGFFFNHCSPLLLSRPLDAQVKRDLGSAQDHPEPFLEITQQIITKLRKTNPDLSTVAFARSIAILFDEIYGMCSNRHDERYGILLRLGEIADEVKQTLQDTLDAQVAMEAQVESLTAEIAVLMEQTKTAGDRALTEREKVLQEEDELKVQQARAERYRRESELAKVRTKYLLMQTQLDLRQRASRDIAVMKTMNHPPKGVFLVMKSIVVIIVYLFIY